MLVRFRGDGMRVFRILASLIVVIQMTPSVQAADSSLPLALSKVFETVFYADASLLSGSGVFSGMPDAVTVNLKAPFRELFAILATAEAAPLKEVILMAGKVEDISVGARRFRLEARPGGTLPRGPAIADACFIIHVRPGNKNLRSLLKFPSTKGSEEIDTWTVSYATSDGSVRRTASITQPTDEYIVIATDSSLIVEARRVLLEPRLQGTEARLAGFDLRKTAYWGNRNYALMTPVPKNTLPVIAIPGLGPSPDATSLTLIFDSEAEQLNTRYVTSLDDQSATYFANIGVGFRDSGQGVWESVISVSRADSFGALFSLFALFGFFIVV